MRILHFSDTHLGFTDLDKVGENGVNLREQDFYDSFKYVIDRALEIRPEIVIHSGDFFHRPSPANRPMIFALEQLDRLAQAEIPIVIIAGNHSTPKTIYTSPILRAFKTIKGVYPIFGQQYELADFGEIVIHGLPHILDERKLQEELDRIRPVDNKLNVILLHTSIGKEYIMDEYGEQLYPPDRIDSLNKFDYVALGHWHNYQRVSKLHAGWYSGSTERMSESEVGKEKGFCLIELEKGKPIEPVFHPVPARKWFKLELNNCKDKTQQEIELELLNAANALELQGALLSINFIDIKPLQSIAFSNRRLQELLPDPVHIYIRRQFVQSDNKGMSFLTHQSESLESLISGFIEANTDDKEKAKALRKQARYYYELYQTGEYKNR